MTLVRRLLVPASRHHQVLGHTLAFAVAITEVVLSLCIASLGGLAVPAGTSGEVLCHPVLAEVPSSSSSSAARFFTRPLVCFNPADAIFFEIADFRKVGISIWWRGFLKKCSKVPTNRFLLE